MRLSKLFFKTLKEAPAEAEIASHQLLIRAGMIKKEAAGIYTFLPLGKRVLAKVEQIIREELDKIGCQELLLSILQSKELWDKSGRWEGYGSEMMHLKDRSEREFALGPTHEEMITNLVKSQVRSYRDLPVCLYQIQTKFRDEIRPRFGLMRAREFVMKDAYSFHTTVEDMQETYGQMSQAYKNIIRRCGLQFRAVEAASGLIGGEKSEEFMILASSGEDKVVYCDNCDYSANIEKAVMQLEKPRSEELKEKEVVKTPGKISVKDVAAFLNVDRKKVVKSLVYLCDGKPVIALLRGDREANETKIQGVLGCNEIRKFEDNDFKKHREIVKGYIGPVGCKSIKIIADEEILHMHNFVTGANQVDSHYINVNYDRDFKADIVADIKSAQAGDKCPKCEGGFKITNGIEVGHIFQVGTKYSKTLEATYLDNDGKPNPIIMGTYGIGVTRLLAAAVEQNHDDKGIIWPTQISPYKVSVIQLDMKSDELKKIAEKIYQSLLDADIEAVYDDRPIRAGVKFADNELIGFPYQIIIGKKSLEEGKVELKDRKNAEVELIAVGEITELLKDTLSP